LTVGVVAAARRSSRGGEQAAYLVLLAPAVGLLVAAYVLPVIGILVLSVTDPVPGLGNYERLISSDTIHRVLWNTARVCVITTVLSMLGGFLLAYAMVNVGSGARQALLFAVLVPFWLSVLVRAFAFVMLLRREGPVNQALMGLGLIAAPLQLSRNEFGVVVGMVHYMLPYAVLPMLANMAGQDRRLVAAARGLGAGAWTTFRRIELPLSLPGIIAAGILVFVFSLGFYITPAILGGGRLIMLAEYISFNVLQNVRWGLATMLAASLLLFVFLLLGLLSRIADLGRLFGAR
jgi:putative spermidine/putrescine transport system permease protein